MNIKTWESDDDSFCKSILLIFLFCFMCYFLLLLYSFEIWKLNDLYLKLNKQQKILIRNFFFFVILFCSFLFVIWFAFLCILHFFFRFTLKTTILPIIFNKKLCKNKIHKIINYYTINLIQQKNVCFFSCPLMPKLSTFTIFRAILRI